eukprot:CAMPEP_0198287208 /NCGR_PEP_ID=MMETSP1449-20131203/6100_1 /TAXON_ID=420275 /ORGANISM="Attheya septentrionalis, Strain CCMP2084" /LENGTH=632 /DNA_ID=CAMNT_0043985131 /DNA_START=92 /DNA_END=1990 /DNA_ORIENTATION=+
MLGRELSGHAAAAANSTGNRPQQISATATGGSSITSIAADELSMSQSSAGTTSEHQPAPQHFHLQYHPRSEGDKGDSRGDDDSEDDDEWEDDDDFYEEEDSEGDSEDFEQFGDVTSQVEGGGRVAVGEHSYLLSEEGRRRRGRRRRKKRNWCSRYARRIGRATRTCFSVLVDVDNVWDSPGMGERAAGRNKWGALFWFVVLGTSYATERSSFKLLVDRAGPFRLFSAEVITGVHALVVGIGMLLARICRKKKPNAVEAKTFGLPLADIGLMAILDTVHLLLGIVTGLHVPPVLSVTLVQFTIPMTALIQQCIHPDGKCSGAFCQRPASDSMEASGHSEEVSAGNINSPPWNDRAEVDGAAEPSNTTNVRTGWGGLANAHIAGSFIIFFSVLLGLTPAILSLFSNSRLTLPNERDVPARTAWNSIVFTLSCIPAAASQLYKEHTLKSFKQPVDPDRLNFLLSIFQFAFAMIVSPLVYTLQGFGAGDDWVDLYPSSSISANFYDGFQCFFGVLDKDVALHGYPEYAECRYTWAFVLMHVFSIVCVGYAVDKIVHAGATKVLYRGISAGIFLAVFAMFIYEYVNPAINYGPIVNTMHFFSLFLLLLGSEVYHRVSMQDATFETEYPVIENLYDDD